MSERNNYLEPNFHGFDFSISSFSEMLFRFHDRDSRESVSSRSSDCDHEQCLIRERLMLEDEDEEEEDDGQEDNNKSSEEESKQFWDTQYQILHNILSRSSSLERRVRNETKDAMKEIQSLGGVICACGRALSTGSCRVCLIGEISGRLQDMGYDSAVCKSKWKSSPNIPSGEHVFIDLVGKSSTKKGEEVRMRVIIELNFRAEFEIARASKEYNQLVERLPEIFVGKSEKLQTLIKILCIGAKRCMKEKKMHLGPWRKHSYMKSKWLGACQRTTNSSMAMPSSSRIIPKPRTSMLTLDLIEKFANLHWKTLEVV